MKFSFQSSARQQRTSTRVLNLLTNTEKLTMTLRLVYAALLIIVAVSQVGCSSGDLSRSEAAEILRELEHRPATRFEKYFQGSQLRVDSDLIDKYSRDIETHLDPLRETGWITYTKAITEPNRFGRSLHYNISPTDKATPFIDSKEKYGFNLSVVSREFGEVTGIVRVNDSTRKVEYTVVSEKTPVASAYEATKPVRDNELSPVTKTATFVLYDDGWRLDSK